MCLQLFVKSDQRLDIGTRIIGCIGIISSLVVIFQTGIDLSENRFPVHMPPLLGMAVGDFHPQTKDQVYSVLKCILTFAVFYAISSSLLIYASIAHNQLLAAPWLSCEAVSFGFHVINAMRIAEDEGKYDERAIISLVFNFVVTAYFWSFVYQAMMSWKTKDDDIVALDLTPPRSRDKAEREERDAQFLSPCKFSSPV